MVRIGGESPPGPSPEPREMPVVDTPVDPDTTVPVSRVRHGFDPIVDEIPVDETTLTVDSGLDPDTTVPVSRIRNSVGSAESSTTNNGEHLSTSEPELFTADSIYLGMSVFQRDRADDNNEWKITGIRKRERDGVMLVGLTDGKNNVTKRLDALVDDLNTPGSPWRK